MKVRFKQHIIDKVLRKSIGKDPHEYLVPCGDDVVEGCNYTSYFVSHTWDVYEDKYSPYRNDEDDENYRVIGGDYNRNNRYDRWFIRRAHAEKVIEFVFPKELFEI